jgi:hypothetical protein
MLRDRQRPRLQARMRSELRRQPQPHRLASRRFAPERRGRRLRTTVLVLLCGVIG